MRSEFCIQGAYVVTMDGLDSELEDGHVHTRNGKIVSVDQSRCQSESAVQIDGAGRIVLPGFVDTHWHLWNVMLRGLVDQHAGFGYFAVKDIVAPHFQPIDTFRATRLALAEALRAGFTTVHNWNHNLQSPEDAEAALDAHTEVGLRARFSYGPPHGLTRSSSIDLGDLERRLDSTRFVPDGLLRLGAVMRPPNVVDEEVLIAEWGFAREHNLPVTFHCTGKRDNPLYADLPDMARRGLLGPDVLVVHAVHVNEEEIELIARTDTAISLCAFTEVRSMGAPPLSELLAAGVRVGLSIDNLAGPTPGDMFLQMRGSYSIERYRNPGTLLEARDILRLATIGGAQAMDLDDQVGSLEVGKRADLLVLDTNRVNMVPCADPVSQVALAADVSNIEYVFVEGEPLVHKGEFLTIDEASVIDDARDSHERLIAASGWNRPVWSPRSNDNKEG